MNATRARTISQLLIAASIVTIIAGKILYPNANSTNNPLFWVLVALVLANVVLVIGTRRLEKPK